MRAIFIIINTPHRYRHAQRVPQPPCMQQASLPCDMAGSQHAGYMLTKTCSSSMTSPPPAWHAGQRHHPVRRPLQPRLPRALHDAPGGPRGPARGGGLALPRLRPQGENANLAMRAILGELEARDAFPTLGYVDSLVGARVCLPFALSRCHGRVWSSQWQLIHVQG